MRNMKRRDFLGQSGKQVVGLAAAASMMSCDRGSLPARSTERPNIIILFADDMGYGDWEGGGHPTIRTPNLMRMAREGTTVTQFYAGCPYCSPSRAALLTGRNYIRTGVIRVFFPGDERGMSPDEITIADILKQEEYKTACIGKWHLGERQEYRPQNQGFDYYYGLLHSNNMYDFKLYRNNEVIEDPVDQSTLTKRYTEEAVKFIENSGDTPFFLYLPYTMPHVPVHASDRFAGKSRNGDYGDAVEEIDWSVGVLLDTLERLGLSENTLVVFTSDNGPAMYKSVPRGSSGLLRGCKGDTWEGGMRVPFIARWTGKIPAGSVSRAVGSVTDLLPLVTAVTGIATPSDRPYDGVNLMPVLKGDEPPERSIFYYRADELYAIRHGKWKLHFKIFEYPGGDYHIGQRKVRVLEEPILFNLEIDPSERYDMAPDYPDVVHRLIKLSEAYKIEIKHYNENADLIEWFNTDFLTKEHKLTGKN